MAEGAGEVKKSLKKNKPSDKIQSTFSVCVETQLSQKKTKGFVNFCYHDNILPPLTEAYTLADISDPNLWAYIPFSASSKITVKKSGKTILYYDVHCAQIVCDKIKDGDLRHRMGLLTFVLKQLGAQEKLEFITDMRVMKLHDNYISTRKTLPEHSVSKQANY